MPKLLFKLLQINLGTLKCFLTILDKSFKTDVKFCVFLLREKGGIGGFINPVDKDEGWNKLIVRFFYDNIYFILLMIIMLNILLG